MLSVCIFCIFFSLKTQALTPYTAIVDVMQQSPAVGAGENSAAMATAAAVYQASEPTMSMQPRRMSFMYGPTNSRTFSFFFDYWILNVFQRLIHC